ncbi:nicotinate-nucleotide--dimethylbenzimidazole phosphoribosyltransferase [Sphingopyxis panaciterrulae]|uniref:Nicotinate-nucleotide--dimethylbenzimidazole phosphoribosyltransferase n=1 Tax=Sphingopyxis panaciterrulae TaxID=462372 RepID=A0A7W9B838_9SPHN|nr:nicotinate-nucleotide--dimethylbenzimidazole phosphoribosyltransferase [Sphingopyxis panaciterrulae]MBB5707980.1 nicotinate-nucleotide--dimethylbenzimidazole phosphoribosyltransferase [Sphingopyxis panaciterrulae]
MTAFASIADFEAALARPRKADGKAQEAASARQMSLTKPAGSLGRLEEIAIFFAGWQSRERPRLDRARAAIFAGNHGVAAHGVSAFPSAVTAQMVANFETGGAAINALSATAGLELEIVALDLDRPTADFTSVPAMTQAECLDALNAGAEAVEPDLDLIVLGEMGIANSTAAAALCARSLGGTAADWVGPGTGVGAEGVTRKVEVVERALAVHAYAGRSAFETLRRVGGRETAAIAGAAMRARQLGVPVLLDGFICCAAIAPMAADNPAIADHCIAGHCSAERGHALLLDKLGLDPLLSLGMRLGEGSGAAVAAGVVRAALAAHDRMATFAQAAVSASP